MKEYDEEVIEALRRSSKQIGFKNPVKVGPDGHIIAGHHRLKADDNWPRVTIPDAKTLKIRLIERLADDFIRRTPPKRELREILNSLAKEYRSEGVEGSLSEIIAKDTGLSLRTVQRYLKGEYLDTTYHKEPRATPQGAAIRDQPKPAKQDFIESADWHCPICNDHVAVLCNGRRHKLQVISSGG